jgi:hypothetical protein
MKKLIVLAIVLVGCSSDAKSTGTTATTTTQPAAVTSESSPATEGLAPGTGTTVPATTLPATTTVPPATKGAKVVVANASITNGAAGVLTLALKGKGFDMVKATNAAGAEAKLDKTKIYYDSSDAATLPVAKYLASVMGGAVIDKLPSPVPVKGGKMPDGATILVMLGNDKSDKTLAEMNGTESPGTASSTTVPGTGTSKSTTTVKKGTPTTVKKGTTTTVKKGTTTTVKKGTTTTTRKP